MGLLSKLGLNECIKQHTLDALVFSLAAYEPTPDKVLAVLRFKYDLPIGVLDILPSEEFNLDRPGPQPFVVGRSSPGLIIVACRGTANFADLVQDFKFLPKRLHFAEGAAHFGFVERAQSIDVQPFVDLVLSGNRIVFTGHSLGGAVASLVALRVLEAEGLQNLCPHQRRVECITFGAPLFADAGLACTINTRYRDLFCHIVAKHDFVPKLLPLVAAAQRVLWGGPHDHLEVLRLARLGLEFVETVTKCPVATAVRMLEHGIPGPIRFIGHWALRLLWCESEDRYVFAGNVLVLDRGAVEEKHAIQLTKAEELNWWTSQLGFALGVNFSGFSEHGLMSYYKGLARALSTRLTPLGCARRPDAYGAVVSKIDGGETETAPHVADHREVTGGMCIAPGHGSTDIVERPFGPAAPSSKGTVASIQLNSGNCPYCVSSLEVYATCELTLERRAQGPRRRVFRFRWILSTIGKASRHLRSLNSVCLLFTVVKFVLKNQLF